MATNILPHNLREAIDAVVAYVDPGHRRAGPDEAHQGPRLPDRRIIVGHGGIREAYETGRGRVVVRGRAHIEPMERGKERIIVTEMPYQVYKGDGRGDGGGLIRRSPSRSRTDVSRRSPTSATSPTARASGS